ncbi:hypothetical protein DFS34DRAFT_636023 [Phlyctochytrium arcticum]|nr:hypothetical protein DFS34DRAFT_636023 [Phlyctochytrium arcticum]
MCVLALAVGTGLVYYRKSKKVRRFASLRTQSRRSGSLRVYRVATSNKNARKGGLEEDSADTVLASAQPGHAATGAPEGRFDSNRNVVIPLLAPIQPTDGSLGRGPWDEHGNIMPGGVDRRPTVPRKQGDVSGADSRDLSTVMQQQFGDLSHIQFDSGGGLSVAAFPVRQESIVRKNKTPDYLLSSTDPHGQPVAASMSAAMSTAMASALTTDPHKYQDPHQQEHPYDERQGSPTSPSTGRHTPAPSTSSGGGYVLDEALRYIVVYPHVPRMIDEVELRPGDEVAVRKLYKDGWCRGTNVTTQQTGCFPLLAVEDSTAYEGQDDVVEFWDGGAGFYNNQQPLTVVNPLDDHRRGSTESDREADYHDAASTTTGGFSVLLGGNSGYGADVAGQDHPPMGEVRRGSGDEYGYGYGFGYGEEKIKNTDAMSTKSKPLSPTSDGQANGHDDDRTRLL